MNSSSQKVRRVSCFIDGFNLYHALDGIGCPQFKWLDLRTLMGKFTDQQTHKITDVFYFSAYASWLPAPYERHKQYVTALESTGVIPVLGQFKEKNRQCHDCGKQWVGHEEKETDVNMALWLLNEAHLDNYDEAFVVTRDSDLAPAVNLILSSFPTKAVKIIAPPLLRHSKELGEQHSRKKLASIKPIHLAHSQLPDIVSDSRSGRIVAQRPPEYVGSQADIDRVLSFPVKLRTTNKGPRS